MNFMMEDQEIINQDSKPDETCQSVGQTTAEVSVFHELITNTDTFEDSSTKDEETSAPLRPSQLVNESHIAEKEENVAPAAIELTTSSNINIRQEVHCLQQASTPSLHDKPPDELVVTKPGSVSDLAKCSESSNNPNHLKPISENQLLHDPLFSPETSVNEVRSSTSKPHLNNGAGPSTNNTELSTEPFAKPSTFDKLCVPRRKDRLLREDSSQIQLEENHTNLSVAPSSFHLIKLVRRRPLLYDQAVQLNSKPMIEKLWGSVAAIMKRSGFHNLSTWEACASRWRNIVDLFTSARKQYFMRVKKNPNFTSELPLPKSQLYRKMIWYAKHHNWGEDQAILGFDRSRAAESGSDDEQIEQVLNSQKSAADGKDSAKLKMMFLTPEITQPKRTLRSCTKRDMSAVPPIGDYDLAAEYYKTQLKMLSFSAQRKFLKKVGDCFFKIFKKDSLKCPLPPMLPHITGPTSKKKTRTVGTQITWSSGNIPSISRSKPLKTASTAGMPAKVKQNLQAKAREDAAKAVMSENKETSRKRSGKPVVKLTDLKEYGITPDKAIKIASKDPALLEEEKPVEVFTTKPRETTDNQPTVIPSIQPTLKPVPKQSKSIHGSVAAIRPPTVVANIQMASPTPRFLLINSNFGIPVLCTVQSQPLPIRPVLPTPNPLKPTQQLTQVFSKPPYIPRKSDQPIVYTVQTTTSRVKVEPAETALQIDNVYSVVDADEKARELSKSTDSWSKEIASSKENSIVDGQNLKKDISSAHKESKTDPKCEEVFTVNFKNDQ